MADFEGLEFDLSGDLAAYDLALVGFFERVEGYGIRLLPINGHPVSVPGYGYNNGYYSSHLTLVLERPDKTGWGVTYYFDISKCQDIEVD